MFEYGAASWKMLLFNSVDQAHIFGVLHFFLIFSLDALKQIVRALCLAH